MRALPPRLVQVEKAIIYGLFARFLEGQGGFHLATISGELLGNKVGEPQIVMALNSLIEGGDVHVGYDEDNFENYWSITNQGYRKIEQLLHDGNEEAVRAWNNGAVTLLGRQEVTMSEGASLSATASTAPNAVAGISEAPLATDANIPAAGRLVRLNDNEEAFAEFQTNLTDLIRAIQTSAKETNLSHEDAVMLEGQLDIARRIVQNSPILTHGTLEIAVLAPVKYISDRVASGVIGALAVKLIEFLAPFLHLS
ncbi:MAG: hypothetical protein WAW54_11330 [Parvibaculum sedimenti]|uniref:hypothetical protein n=1 Tax=Parvibaculum sedimenti TaxID=2608632 RepID=UPI003BB7FC5A